MKRILFILTLLIITSNASFALSESYRNLEISNNNFQKTCMNISKNFRSDKRFGNYMKYQCMLFENSRQKTAEAILPLTNSSGAPYKKNYNDVKAALMITLNQRELDNYKFIINEYCKNNSFRFVEEKVQPCSAQSINSIFGN